MTKLSLEKEGILSYKKMLCYFNCFFLRKLVLEVERGTYLFYTICTNLLISIQRGVVWYNNVFFLFFFFSHMCDVEIIASFAPKIAK